MGIRSDAGASGEHGSSIVRLNAFGSEAEDIAFHFRMKGDEHQATYNCAFRLSVAGAPSYTITLRRSWTLKAVCRY